MVQTGRCFAKEPFEDKDNRPKATTAGARDEDAKRSACCQRWRMGGV